MTFVPALCASPLYSFHNRHKVIVAAGRARGFSQYCWIKYPVAPARNIICSKPEIWTMTLLNALWLCYYGQNLNQAQFLLLLWSLHTGCRAAHFQIYWSPVDHLTAVGYSQNKLLCHIHIGSAMYVRLQKIGEMIVHAMKSLPFQGSDRCVLLCVKLWLSPDEVRKTHCHITGCLPR